jgi:hypothetical protein
MCERFLGDVSVIHNGAEHGDMAPILNSKSRGGCCPFSRSDADTFILSPVAL